MPTYYTSTVVEEDGIGPVTVRVAVSDTYAGLLAEGTPVTVLTIKRTRGDLDLFTGVYAEDEAEMTVYEWASEDPADQAVMAFVLEAQDPAVARYLAVFINPSTPIQADEIEFRGRVRSDMRWTDVEWDQEEYVPPGSIIREWEITAGSFDVSAILDSPLWSDADTGTVGLTASLDAATLGVADVPGWFYDDGSADQPYAEARFGDMVDFAPVVQALLDAAAPAGVTLTYAASSTGIEVAVAEMVPKGTGSIRQARYCYKFNPNVSGPLGAAAPFRIPGESEWFALWTGDDGAGHVMQIDWKLLFGYRKEEESISWKRYTTLAELLYGLAATFDSYVVFTYASAVDITITFAPRTEIVGDMVVLRDAIQSSGDIAANSSTTQRRGFSGAGSMYTREGAVPYQFDGGGYIQLGESDRPGQGGGELLPLTVSPAWCDFGSSRFIPHNAVLYDNPATPLPDSQQRVTRGVTSGIHVRMTATAEHGGYGIAGREVTLPVRAFRAQGEGVEIEVSDTLSEWLNKMRGFDERFFAKQLSQDVPGLMGFLKAGVYDWRHCTTGAQFSYDLLTWTIAGIERDYEEWVTRIRSQESSRFLLSPPNVTDAANGTDSESIRRTGAQFVRIGSSDNIINEYDVVSVITGWGLIERSRAIDGHYRRVLGIATTSYDAEVNEVNEVVVQLYGRVQGAAVMVPDAQEGQYVFMRTGVPNLSISPLTTKTTTENLYQPIGWRSGDDIILDIQEPRVYQ